MSAQLGEAIVAQYVEDGVICLPVSRNQLFTTAAVDKVYTNILSAYIMKKANPPPAVSQSLLAPKSIWSHLKEEYSWLEEVFLIEDHHTI